MVESGLPSPHLGRVAGVSGLLGGSGATLARPSGRADVGSQGAGRFRARRLPGQADAPAALRALRGAAGAAAPAGPDPRRGWHRGLLADHGSGGRSDRPDHHRQHRRAGTGPGQQRHRPRGGRPRSLALRRRVLRGGLLQFPHRARGRPRGSAKGRPGDPEGWKGLLGPDAEPPLPPRAALPLSLLPAPAGERPGGAPHPLHPRVDGAHAGIRRRPAGSSSRSSSSIGGPSPGSFPAPPSGRSGCSGW